jgi:hypothetical protein
MSARKLSNSSVFQPTTIYVEQARCTQEGELVRIHPSGIEFHVPEPLTVWREMSVALQPPNGGRKMRCTGVVVACQGNRHSGYLVSLLFLNLSKHSQEQLRLLADFELG